MQTPKSFLPRLDRRGFVRVSALGALSLLIERAVFPSLATAAEPKAKAPAAKACIVLWMNGGPSHLDTFDLKPNAKGGGPFKPIKTRAPGVEICQHLPQLADKADRLVVCRGMTSGEGNHQRARYLMHTGYAPTPTVTHPSFGSWVSEELSDSTFELPHFVSINVFNAGGGFLGPQHAPFVVQDPSSMPQNAALPSGVDRARLDARTAMLGEMEGDFARMTGDPKVSMRRAVYERSTRLMRSSRLSAFDIAEEPAAVRAAYGDTDFGRGCLLARRLVEAGVSFVEVVLDGWDTHENGFDRSKKLMGALDPAMSKLIDDLTARKMLDRTLVVCMGEFGRTPAINAEQGRDHHPKAWSAVLAGGGMKKGIAYGQTDENGEKVVKSPVKVPDLFATMAHLIGLEPDKLVPTPAGRPIMLTDGGVPVKALMA